MEYYDQDIDSEIRAQYERPSPNIVGLYKTDGGEWMFDRRTSLEGMEGLGSTVRSIDFNLIGPAFIPVPDYLVEELGI